MMKHKLVTLGMCLLAGMTVAACGNSKDSESASSSSAKSSKVVKKVPTKKQQKKDSTSESAPVKQSSTAAVSSAAAKSTDPGLHLTGGQSTIDYLNKVKGDQGWVIDSGTYGGAHGAPTTPDYVPYNRVRNAAGTRCYYVYANGKIVVDTDSDVPVDSNADTDD
ncbi:MAG TPA: hypothetical protein H9720_06320 [Candidatus Limosilactobacillus intestinigallinarum]|nr:hypothetical protein [Candidatus Limosilactobacillus intestinigallinarum]